MHERAQPVLATHRKNINDLHVKLGHPSKSITHATVKAMGIQVTGDLKPCEDSALGKTQMSGVSKKVVAYSKILGEMLFFNISSPSSPTFWGKMLWLLVMEDINNLVLSFFLKEKSDLAGVMLGLIKTLKNKYNMQVQYLLYDNSQKHCL